MSKNTTREVLFEKIDVSSNITYLFLIENLENTNIKTKKIELTHNPVTQIIPASIWYRNLSNVFPKYMQ